MILKWMDAKGNEPFTPKKMELAVTQKIAEFKICSMLKRPSNFEEYPCVYDETIRKTTVV